MNFRCHIIQVYYDRTVKRKNNSKSLWAKSEVNVMLMLWILVCTIMAVKFSIENTKSKYYLKCNGRHE